METCPKSELRNPGSVGGHVQESSVGEPSGLESGPRSAFWDALAPLIGPIENSYFNLPSLRRILPRIRSPVLVVGAGQGLIVGELKHRGYTCDGIDYSDRMIEFARKRRGIELIKADARALPFENGRYQTVIIATGVFDFIQDESQIRRIVLEGKRVAAPSGTIFAAFLRISDAVKNYMVRVGLLRDNQLFEKRSLELYLFSDAEAIAWTAKQANLSWLRAACLMLRTFAFSTTQEKRVTRAFQKALRNNPDARVLIDNSHDVLPYREATEIRNLFARISVPVREVRTLGSCYIAVL